MTTAYIIRHAHKEAGEFFNARLRHQDEPISRPGREEAGKLCSFFEDKPVSAIYVSDYQRTAQTAHFLAERLGLKPVVETRLNEFDNGLLDNMTETEIREKYPEVWQAFQTMTSDFRYPGGETGAEAQARIADFLEEKRTLHTDGFIAVCHEGLIRLMMCHVMGLPVYRRGNFKVDFCGITEIQYRPDPANWKLIRFNQICL